MGRDRFFRRGGSRGSRRGNFKRHFDNRNGQGSEHRKREFVQHEQLKEVEVGISEYFSDTEGVSGVIKARYSDFHVSEINLDGEIAQLTDTQYPVDFYEKEVVVPEDISGIDKPLEQIPDEIWKGIIEMLQSNENEKRIEMDATELTKEDRTLIHEGLKKVLGQKIVASTLSKDSKKIMEFRKYNKKDKSDTRFKWPENKGEYVYFLVYKECTDTMEAAFKISDCLRLASASFTYAGVKDKRAKTTQWFCARKVDPRKLVLRTKPMRNIHVGNITFKNVPLKLGQLKGNRFRIAIRNITADDELINNSLNSLKEKGFINYFGLQRFGNDKEVPTFQIGIKLMQGNWKEACNLILKLKKSDDPFSDITKAKKVYEETSDSAKAYGEFYLNKNKCVESKLLLGLSNTGPNEYVNALEQIPRNMRLMYIHSFQSLIWNNVASRRIKEFGLKPIPGDIVLLSEDENAALECENVPLEGGDESQDNGEEKKTKNKESEANISEEDSPPIKRQEVKILTEDELGRYTIYDIVMPLPGYDVSYPENISKDWYKELLEEHGLSLEMPKQKVKTYTLSGAYRKLVGQVQNLSWRTMRYDEPNDTLILSDMEEIKGEEEPKDIPDGRYKALVIEFCLNSACYATMVLREILKTDTSCSEHSKLNNYHASKPPLGETEEVNYAKTESLLADPDKFAEFKKAIFSAPAQKRTIDEEPVAIPAKKPKENSEVESESSLKVEPSLI